MGLDIYLYEREANEANDKHFAASDALYERPDYDQLSEAQRRELRDALPPYVPHVDVPSRRYPDHLFNRRYLRSSYNAGGFNRAIPDFVGADHGLYWIFEPLGRTWDGDEGVITAADVPALRDARKRAEQVAEELRACEPLRTISTSVHIGSHGHMWRELPRESVVLDWYRQEKERNAGNSTLSEGYSNAKGLVLGFAKGVEVLALTLGVDILGTPCAVAVYRASTETVEAYVQSAEIVAEFCDEAIALIERDGSAYLSWSG